MQFQKVEKFTIRFSDKLMSTNQPIITDTEFSEVDLGTSKASEFFKLVFTKLITIPHITLPNIGFNSFELKNNSKRFIL